MHAPLRDRALPTCGARRGSALVLSVYLLSIIAVLALWMASDHEALSHPAPRGITGNDAEIALQGSPAVGDRAVSDPVPSPAGEPDLVVDRAAPLPAPGEELPDRGASAAEGGSAATDDTPPPPESDPGIPPGTDGPQNGKR